VNIFKLDDCPQRSAELQHDKHVVKMILESAQLLCGAYGTENTPPYKRTHYNHPCSIWTRTSRENYEWLISHAMSLSYEYTRRYGRVHKSQAVIEWCSKNIDLIEFTDSGFTELPMAMPDEYKSDNVVTAYRQYYINEKLNQKTGWKARNVPKIFKNKMELIQSQSV